MICCLLLFLIETILFGGWFFSYARFWRGKRVKSQWMRCIRSGILKDSKDIKKRIKLKPRIAMMGGDLFVSLLLYFFLSFQSSPGRLISSTIENCRTYSECSEPDKWGNLLTHTTCTDRGRSWQKGNCHLRPSSSPTWFPQSPTTVHINLPFRFIHPTSSHHTANYNPPPPSHHPA